MSQLTCTDQNTDHKLARPIVSIEENSQRLISSPMRCYKNAVKGTVMKVDSHPGGVKLKLSKPVAAAGVKYTNGGISGCKTHGGSYYQRDNYMEHSPFIRCFRIKCLRDLHCSCSQLNGTNGEWTNGDDMADNHNRQQARMRIGREDRNHLQAGGHRGGNHRGPRVLDGVVAPVVAEVEELEIANLVSKPHCRFAYDGKKFYTRHVDGEFYTTDGAHHQNVIIHGTPVVGKFYCGWVVTHPRLQQDGMAKAAFNDFHHAAHCYDGNHVSAIQGTYFVPGFDLLIDKLPPGAAPSLQRVKNMTGLLSRSYPGIPVDAVIDTVNHMVAYEVELYRKLQQSTYAMRVFKKGDTSEFDPIQMRVAQDLGHNGLIDGFHQVAAEECDIVPDWMPKDIFKVSCVGADCNLQEHLANRAIPFQYPMFRTRPHPHHVEKLRTTVMCRFSGRRPFQKYAITPNNAELALMRFMGGRADEARIYTSQLQLLHELDDSGCIEQKVLKALKVKFVDAAPHARMGCCRDEAAVSVCVGEGEGLHHIVQLQRVRQTPPPVMAGIKKMMARISRSSVDQFVDGYKTAANWAYHKAFEACLELCESKLGRDICAEIPHIKRQLRKSYVNGVEFHGDDCIMVDRLSAVIKKEWAKAGKYPRLFVSYGAGCMYANDLPEYVKTCLDKGYYFPKGTLWDDGCVQITIMAKPKSEKLAKIFNDLIAVTTQYNEIHIAIYSDDSVYAGNINGVPFGKNVDIKSCDSGNCSMVFGIVGTLLSNFNMDRALGLVQQCMLPVTLANPIAPQERIKIQFHSAFEGSGTVLTTILNHVASYVIALNFIGQLNVGHEVDEAIQTGAGKAGHIVTIDSWVIDGVPVFEKIQFIKYSPLRTVDGMWIPTLNYGCIYRSLGTIEGDLMAKHLDLSEAEFKCLPWADRMDRFMGGVVAGFVNEPHTGFLDALRERFPLSSNCKPIKFDNQLSAEMLAGGEVEDLVYGCLRSSYTIDDDSINRRYDTQTYDLEELCDHTKRIRLGEDSVTDAITAFFLVDYGL